MWERLHHMLMKEFIQTFRDPRMKGVIFAAPIIQLLLLSYAVTTDVRNVRLLVQDMDHSPASRALIDDFTGSSYFRKVGTVQCSKDVEAALNLGDAQLLLHIPPGFQGAIRQGRPAPVQLLLDGSDSNTAAIVLQYANRIIQQHGKVLMEQTIRRRGADPGMMGSVTLEKRAWFNENLNSRWFFVPGTIAVLVTLISLMLTGMAVVREKEIGTMEQIMVTPIRASEFILGKTLPFVVISLLDVLLVTLVGVVWFAIPIRGSLWVMLLGTLCYLLTTLGIGLLISTLSSTQQQAMLSTFFFFLPAMLLSGFFFPIANMPTVIQWITVIDPLRYFLVIIRGVFLKGVGLDVLWPEFVALFTMGVGVMLLAVARFRKTVM